jgi:hypothetical protein
VLYAPALGAGYLSDDFVLAADGLSGDYATPRAGRFYRPVASLILALLAQQPSLMHALLLTLHGMNAYLVLRLGEKTMPGGAAAAVAGVLFLTFPGAPEAVVWCSGIQDVLMTSLALLYTSVFLGPGTLALRAVVCQALLLVGLGVKETSVVFPLLALSLILVGRFPTKRELAWLCAPSLVTAALYGAWRIRSPGVPTAYFTPPTRQALKDLVVRTFAALACPWHSDMGGLAMALGVGIVCVAPFAVVLAASRLTQPGLKSVLGFGAWMLLAVGPVYTMLYVSPELEGSRYVYMSAVGWCLLTARVVCTALPRSGGIGVIVVALVLALNLPALRFNMVPWWEAAAARDRVLEAARRRLQVGDCRTLSGRGLPDSVRGAYVFRNGFDEAVRMGMGELLQPGGEACEWTYSAAAR